MSLALLSRDGTLQEDFVRLVITTIFGERVTFGWAALSGNKGPIALAKITTALESALQAGTISRTGKEWRPLSSSKIFYGCSR